MSAKVLSKVTKIAFARMVIKILLFPLVILCGFVGWALIWLSKSLDLEKKKCDNQE